MSDNLSDEKFEAKVSSNKPSCNNCTYGLVGCIPTGGKESCRGWEAKEGFILRWNEDNTFSEIKGDPTPNYYNHNFNGKKLDVYRVQLAMNITHPIQQHIHKKISRIHLENHKSVEETLEDIIKCCQRWKEIINEDKENT